MISKGVHSQKSSGMIFAGVKVAAFTVAVVGNLTLRYISDFGAAVVFVESRTRPDAIRTMPPFKGNTPHPDRTPYFANQHPNMYGVSLNLSHPQAIGVAKKLIAWADIVAENFAPGVMDRWGLGYDEVKQIKPDVIMIRMSNQGQTGPHSAMPAYGTHLTALTGFTNLVGWPDRGPAKAFGAYTDFVAPRFAATALIAAMDYRRRTGQGLCIDLSQYESSAQFLAPILLDYTVNGRVAKRKGNRCDYAAPHGVYRCQGNDKWCAIAVFTDQEWAGLCNVIGSPERTRDQRFTTLLDRLKNSEELDRLIEQWTASHSAEEVMTLMQAAGVAAGVVKTCEELYQDPQLEHREHWVTLNHKEIGPHPYRKLSFRLSKTPSELRTPAPCLGEHNEYVYKNILGLSDDEVAGLLTAGALE